MEFDMSRVYTALNADELKVGSKVIAANNIDSLKCNVRGTCIIFEVREILDECYERRFRLDCKGAYPLVYLVSEPEEKKLNWTDLKLGDVIRNKDSGLEYLVTGLDKRPGTRTHVYFASTWASNSTLEFYEKVEE